MEADEMEDVVDTSDMEEKEVMEAQKPGYYDKVWGVPEIPDGQSEVMEINDPLGALARLRHRTPSPRKIQPIMNFDPSPIFSHLQISLDSQSSDSHSKTSATTHVLAVSYPGPPESMVIASSPDLGGFESENSQPSNNLIDGHPLVDTFSLTSELYSLQGPIYHLSLIPPRRSFEQSQSLNMNGTREGGFLESMSDTEKETAQNSASLLNRIGSLTPPLEFPESPPSQLIPISLPDVLPDSNPFLVIDVEKSRVQTTSVVNLPDAGSSSVGHLDPLPLRDVTTNGSQGCFGSPPNARPGRTLFSDFENPEPLPSPVELQNDPLRSMSPLTPPPPTQSPSSRMPPGSTLNPPPHLTSPIIIPDLEPQHRKYSLRHRSAKQLNPFEYDKRQYKRLLRDMPEAIVKDPNLGGGRAGRKERYREEGKNNWEQGEGDAEGDWDEEWRAQEKRKERQLLRKALEARMREFGINLESSEEDEVLMEIDRADNQQAEEWNMRGKKRKRRLRVRGFPMVAELENPQASPSVQQPTPPTHPSPKPRPRPRPNYHRPSPTFPHSVRAVSVVSLDEQINVDLAFGSNLPTDSDKDRRNSPILVHSSEDEVTPNPRKGRLKRHTLDGDVADVQILEEDAGGPESAKNDEESDESQDSGDVELTGKARKQLKALSRMMPGVLRNKLLANAENKQQSKAKELTGRRDSDHGDFPLQPGRGRKRIVSPSSRDPKMYEVKGDTESESSSSSSENVRMSDREVIVVDGDGEDEEDAERALEVSDDGLDAEDIQTWLAPELQEEEVLHETTRRHRPESGRDRPRGGDLIDRMLQRTKRVVPQRPQATSQRKPQIKGPRNPAIDVVTREARRLSTGGGRQTKLAFPRVEGRGKSSTGKCQESSSGAAGPSKKGDQEHHVNLQKDKSKKSKKKQRGLVHSKLFIIQGDGYKATTGRPRQIIHIDNDDDAFHEALAPVESIPDPYAPSQYKAKVRRSRPDNIHDKFCHEAGTEPDAFDVDMNGPSPRHSKISLDFDLVSLPSGLTLGPDTYIGRGRLYDFISILKGDKEPPSPFSVTLFELQIDPDMPIAQISPTFAATCDKLYDGSTMSADDNEVLMSVKAADALMHALCQMVSFRALHTSEEEEGLLVTIVSEQMNHLVARINDRVELISADGHSMDYRSLMLYWFAVEMHLRLAYAHQKRLRQTDTSSATSHAAEQYCVQLLRRLLEYGLDRTIGLLQNGCLLDTSSSNLRVLELWICVFHVAPFLTGLPVCVVSKPTPPFWRVVEAAMDAQSNKPDSQLYESERIWRTIFSLCAVSQFSLEGFSTSAARLEAHWPIVKKALKCIRLSADVRDNSKPASTLHKRDTYLRLVTARCFLLCTRWKWCLNDADDMFQELCAIFRSRQFSNLLGEPDDFPAFIRLGNETFLDSHQKDDTAFGLFLKLIVRAAKDFLKMEGPGRLRRGKLVRLLNLAVPVGSTTFTKDAPPTGQGLSMLYNRYSAIFVAIYVDSSATNIRSRLQQIRRYIAFKDADCDSRAASIRSMMHLGILLRHLSKPLDDVLSWASIMIDDLIEELTSLQARDGDPAHNGRNELVVLVQLLLGSIRNITSKPMLNHSGDLPVTYPDIGLLQAWMTRIISSSLAKDHRTGLEICKCIQNFLVARQAIIPLPSIPKPSAGRESQESQDEYGDGGLDLNDPALLAFLDDIEDRPDENSIADQNASEILDTFSQSLFTCVCMHLGCTTVGGRYSEADQWLECWLGCGSVLVRNKKRVWDYYFQLGESAWKDISDSFRRLHLRLRLMLTILRLDPTIYKSHANQILALWFESIVSPNPTIEHDFTARLFSIDGLRHALFQNIPCVADIETGYFAFDLDEFKRLRQQFIEVILSNVSTALNSGLGLYIPWVETLLCTTQRWVEVMNRDVMRQVEYIEFVKKIILTIRNHDALTRHPSLQNLLNWGGSL